MSRRRGAAAFVAAASLTIGGVSAATAFATNGGQDEHKTSICHRTASDSNPYVFETVADASLQAHLSNGKGHFPKEWKSDGTFRGVAHVAGDVKFDYLATVESDCEDTQETEPTSPPTTEPTSPPTSEPTTAPTETPPTSEPTTETPAPSETPTPKPTPKPRPHTITHPDPAPPPPPVVIDAGL